VRGDALGAADDAGTGGRGHDLLVGDDAAGVLASGDGGNDMFMGDRKSDILIGDNEALVPGAQTSGGGNDFLRGGPSHDRFHAGPGQNHCQGGPGHDWDLSAPQCEKRDSIP
jgi:hypothetical protein